MSPLCGSCFNHIKDILPCLRTDCNAFVIKWHLVVSMNLLLVLLAAIQPENTKPDHIFSKATWPVCLTGCLADLTAVTVKSALAGWLSEWLPARLAGWLSDHSDWALARAEPVLWFQGMSQAPAKTHSPLEACGQKLTSAREVEPGKFKPFTSKQ